MCWTLSENSLVGDVVTGTQYAPFQSVPATASAAAQVDRSDLLHRQTSDLHSQAGELLSSALTTQLQELQGRQAKRSPVDLLTDLADLGFAWRDIARLVGVSVPAVSKWRRGEKIIPANRFKIAKVRALVMMIEDRLISEPVSWLEMPLREGVSVTCLDLLAAGRFDLVLRHANEETGDANAEAVLDEYDPTWRETAIDSTFESYVAADGMISIRPRP